MAGAVRRFAVVWLGLWGACSGADEADCDSDAEARPDPAPLFGVPAESTGLDDSMCQPSCEGCPVGFAPPTYGPDDVTALQAWELSEPMTGLTGDPYLAAPPPTEPGACAVVVDDATAGTYHLQTFASEEEALSAEAFPTHGGACGLCSSLADLAVYMANPDLTEPVRACGLDAAFGGEGALLECLEQLGFSTPCAQIWMYNVEHTRAECQGVCLELLTAPYHGPDGTLNACLQCDEDRSGPVFKAVAGRTRRNSGLASALCRPCDTVWSHTHDYEQ